MSVHITEHVPEVRCYKCGSIKIEAVCHHCQKAMCASHTLRQVDEMGNLLSTEFADLDLENSPCRAIPIHCEQCNHSIPPYTLKFLLVGVLFIFISIAIFDNVGKIIGGLIGSALVLYGYGANQQNKSKGSRTRPPLPLLPHFHSLQIRETLRSQITLDSAGKYTVSTISAEGLLCVASNFGKAERDQLQRYRKKYDLSDREEIQLHAGFISLGGSAQLMFSDATANNADMVTALTDRVSAQPSLTVTNGRPSEEWRKDRKYRLLDMPGVESFPLRVIPSLLQEGAQRALDLEIQWPELDSLKNGVTIHRIGQLELQVPVSWGEVESLADSATVGSAVNARNGEPVRTITWRGLPILEKERHERRRTFSVRFEDKINLETAIHGRLDVTFKGAFSQLEGIGLYYPLGGKRETETTDITTQVLVDFELSLAGLRYQEVRVVPDPQKDVDKQETLTFEGVIPDHNTVIALTNGMSESFYVKRVIENPPRTGEQANVVNRYWDIAGRYYLGVYPIDYHVILVGEAVYGGAIEARSGFTKTTLTVQGAYANDAMEAQIENVWEQLNHLIRTTLNGLPRKTSSPEETSSQTKLFENTTTNTMGNKRAERIETLHKQLDQLLEALVGGRISEDTFLKLKAETEQKLQLLQVEV